MLVVAEEVPVSSKGSLISLAQTPNMSIFLFNLLKMRKADKDTSSPTPSQSRAKTVKIGIISLLAFLMMLSKQRALS